MAQPAPLSSAHRPGHEPTQARASGPVIDRLCQRWMPGSEYASARAGASRSRQGRSTRPPDSSTGWSSRARLPGATAGVTSRGTASLWTASSWPAGRRCRPARVTYQGAGVPSQEKNSPVGPSSGSRASRTAPAAASAGSPSLAAARGLRSVRRSPGASAFTRKPSPARAWAQNTASAFRAVLDERYAAPPPPETANCASGPVLQVSEAVPLEMFTIRGRAERRSAGRKAFGTATTANTFVSYVRRKLSTSASGGVWPSTMMPALLTRTSRSSTCRAASAMLVASVTSSTRSRAPPPISSTARWPRSGSREPTYTVSPAAASWRAISLPMPLLAPVTSAVESFMVSTLPARGQADPGKRGRGRGGGEGSGGDEAGGGGGESATAEVEGPQVLLEVDVQPLAARAARFLDREGHQPGTDAPPPHSGGDHGVEDEGVGATIPGHVDEPGEIPAVPRAGPAEAVAIHLGPPVLGAGIPVAHFAAAARAAERLRVQRTHLAAIERPAPLVGDHGLCGVPGHLLHHHPDDHAVPARRVRAGVGAVVLVGQLDVQQPVRVGGHRHPAAELHVILRVRGVQDADADPRVAEHVAVLHASFQGGEHQVIPVAADPHRGAVRAPVAVDGGEDRVVRPIQQLECLLIERDSHDGTVQPSRPGRS